MAFFMQRLWFAGARRFFPRLFAVGLLAGTVASGAFSGMARAEEPSDALLMRYLDVMNMQETIYSEVESTGNLITASIIREMEKGKGFPQEKVRKFASFLGNKFKENKEFFYKAAIASVLPVMRKYYDREEIEALIAFYETPMGSRIAEKMPLVAAEMPNVLHKAMFPLVIGKIRDWGLEYKEMLQKMRQEGKS